MDTGGRYEPMYDTIIAITLIALAVVVAYWGDRHHF